MVCGARLIATAASFVGSVSRPLATAASAGKFSETIIPPLGETRLGGIAYVGALMVPLQCRGNFLSKKSKKARNPHGHWLFG